MPQKLHYENHGIETYQTKRQGQSLLLADQCT